MEVSWTKNYSTECMERKKKEQIHEGTNRTKRVLNPTIQFVIIILYTKCELSILYGRADNFDEIIGAKKKGNRYREE